MQEAIGFTSHDDQDIVVDVNTTPLIDVMLVLLVMLIITIPVQLHAVKLDLPSGHPPPPVAPPVILQLDITADSQIRWNGEAVPDTATLESRLQAASQQADPPEIHVRPDRASSYRTVAAVMAAIQRQHLHKVGIVGNEQFL